MHAAGGHRSARIAGDAQQHSGLSRGT
jgi:hypothetical protein